MASWKSGKNAKGQIFMVKVSYRMHCNATAVIKIDSVYKQGKSYHPQVYVQECECTYAENQQCSMLNDDDDGFFEM